VKITSHFQTDDDPGAFTPAGAISPGAAFGGGIVATSVTDGVTEVIPTRQLDFTAGATVTDAGGGVAQIAVGAPLTVEDGTTAVTDVTDIKFTSGATVTSGGAGVADVAITGGGGGGGVTIQYPALKPGSPTDDFAAASLDGAWSAHSSVGSFVTGDCMTQGVEWVGSSLEMQFSNQMGFLYRSHSNGDLDIAAGGVSIHHMNRGQNMMFGIAALDTSGNGLAIVSYNDQNAYFASISGWQYASNTDSWSYAGYGNGGTPNGGQVTADYWYRLKRVSGTWTAYISMSGRVWDHTFSTRADSYTVAYVGLGLLLDTGASPGYSGRLTADYFDIAV
jgi:hypothetical protein